MSSYITVSQIGSGSFGVVYKIQHKQSKQFFVLKVAKEMNEQTLKEANILRTLNHPNIVRYIECYYNKDNRTFNIIMEYCDGGNLQELIDKHKKSKQYIDENTIKQIAIKILTALDHIHRKNIMHRDLKPANIFLNKNGDVKIGDFGLAKKLEASYAHSIAGSFLYMAPEIMDNAKGYNNKTDIWSFGIILYEMITNTLPFDDDFSLVNLINKIKTGNYNRIQRNIDINLIRLCDMCLNKNYKLRPDARQALDVLLKFGGFNRQLSMPPINNNMYNSGGFNNRQISYNNINKNSALNYRNNFGAPYNSVNNNRNNNRHLDTEYHSGYYAPAPHLDTGYQAGNYLPNNHMNNQNNLRQGNYFPPNSAYQRSGTSTDSDSSSNLSQPFNNPLYYNYY